MSAARVSADQVSANWVAADWVAADWISADWISPASGRFARHVRSGAAAMDRPCVFAISVAHVCFVVLKFLRSAVARDPADTSTRFAGPLTGPAAMGKTAGACRRSQTPASHGRRGTRDFRKVRARP